MVTLAACAPKGAAKPGQKETAISPTKAIKPTAPVTIPKKDTKEAEELSYDTTGNLSNLKSYRLRSVISVQEEGKDKETVETEIAYVRQPPAQHSIIRWGVASQEGIEVIRIGSDSYARVGSEWIAMQVPDKELTPPAIALYSAENLFRSAKGRYVGQENVNGQPTKHYVYDEKALLQSGVFTNLLEGSGEVWVSTQHNITVRTIAHLKGKDTNTGRITTIDLRSDVTDINADISIKPPEGIGKPEKPDDVPIMSGATDMVSIKGMTSYKVAASVEEVTAFYKSEMTKNGWTSVPSQVPGFISFEKGNRAAQITITRQGDRTAVAIIMQEK